MYFHSTLIDHEILKCFVICYAREREREKTHFGTKTFMLLQKYTYITIVNRQGFSYK